MKCSGVNTNDSTDTDQPWCCSGFSLLNLVCLNLNTQPSLVRTAHFFSWCLSLFAQPLCFALLLFSLLPASDARCACCGLQIYFYHNVRCREEMYNKDIVMLQVSLGAVRTPLKRSRMGRV